MNATNNNTFESELQAVDQEIARSLRMARFHEGDDIYLAQSYGSNADDLQTVRDAVAAGDLAEAGRLADGLEDYVRSEIPKRLFDAIMKADEDAQPEPPACECGGVGCVNCTDFEKGGDEA